jgi:hypothetical protein
MHAFMAFASLVCGFLHLPVREKERESEKKIYLSSPDVILWLMLLEFPEILKKFPVTAVRMCLLLFIPSFSSFILRDFFLQPIETLKLLKTCRKIYLFSPRFTFNISLIHYCLSMKTDLKSEKLNKKKKV